MDEKKKMQERYGKFKQCNLPVSVYDEKRETLEYVYYDPGIRSFHKLFMSEDDTFDKRLHVENNLTSSLSDLCDTGFYFPFNCKYYTFPKDKSSKTDELGRIILYGRDHSHSFEGVVQSLYDFQESFSLTEEDEKFYSNQELKYLNRVKKYLLFLGVKGKSLIDEGEKRYQNERQKKYYDAFIREFSDEKIEDFLSGKKDYFLRRWNEFYGKETVNCDERNLIVNSKGGFVLYIDVKWYEVKKYKEVKTDNPKGDIKDDDLVCVYHFEILERFV